jgi:cytochrome c
MDFKGIMSMRTTLGLTFGAAAVFGLLSLHSVAYAQDAAEGEKVFKKYCLACHALPTEEKNKVGPMLKGVVGRHSGSVESYNYSKANKESGITWDETTLETYLSGPQKFVPGTKMTFVGIKDPVERANVIAFLKAN